MPGRSDPGDHATTAPDRLTLVVNATHGPVSWTVRLEGVTPWVHRVVLVAERHAESLAGALQPVFPRASFQTVRVATAAATNAALDAVLGAHEDWLLLIDAGCDLRVARHFRLPADAAPHSLPHRSRDWQHQFWRPSLVPAAPGCLRIGRDNELEIAAPFSSERCHDALTVLLPGNRPLPLVMTAQRARHDAGESISPPVGSDFHRAARQFASGDYRRAASLYQRCLDNDPDIHRQWLAAYRIARCHVETIVDWSLAEQWLARAFELDPDRAEPLYFLAAHYFEAGRLEKAFELLQIAIGIRWPRTSEPFELAIVAHRLPLLFLQCAGRLGAHQELIRVANEVLRQVDQPNDVREEAAALRSAALTRWQPVHPLCIRRRNRIVVVVPFHNPGGFLERCADSLARQDYAHARFVLIDDASTDGCLDELAFDDPRFVVTRNPQRRGPLFNQLRAIDAHCREDDIVVYVDGDDRLLGDDALKHVNDFFNTTGCWLMYGQFRESNGRYGRCEPILATGEAFNAAIDALHFPMHVRAHRAGLIDRLKDADAGLARLRDEQGEFLDPIADMALMRPLLQLAGPVHARYCDRILYEYNTGNAHSNFTRAGDRLRQDRQTDRVRRTAPLPPATDYRARPRPGIAAGDRARTLFIGLDGMTPRLLHQWAAEGLLPALDALLARTHHHEIGVPQGFGNDAFWNSLVSRCLPDVHGYYYRNVWRPDRYAFECFQLDDELGAEPFWSHWANEGAQMAIIDLPEVKHGGRVNGLEVTEWITHARLLPTRFTPSELQSDWESRFGVDATGGYTETLEPRSAEAFQDLNERLQAGVRQKTDAALHYLERGHWDLFAIAYNQAHDVGHQFWHIHDPKHPAHRPAWRDRYGDPLLQVYQAIDEAVAKLVHHAGDGAEVVIVTGLAMEAKASGNSVLDDILLAIETSGSLSSNSSTRRPCRAERRFFAVPHNNHAGAVRINLSGREAAGRVAPGADYRQTLNILDFSLRELVDADTGDPAVADIVRIQERYSGPRTRQLPDLFVIWDRRGPLRRLHAPWMNTRQTRVRGVTDTRTGDHVGKASLISTFPFAGSQEVVGVETVADRLCRLQPRD